MTKYPWKETWGVRIYFGSRFQRFPTIALTYADSGPMVRQNIITKEDVAGSTDLMTVRRQEREHRKGPAQEKAPKDTFPVGCFFLLLIVLNNATVL